MANESTQSSELIGEAAAAADAAEKVQTRRQGLIAGLAVWAVIGGLIVWNVAAAWMWLYAVVLAVVALAFAVPQIRERVMAWTPTTRTGILVVGIIPLALLGVVALVFLPDVHHAFALNMTFWFVASLLPASMYYLFIGTRKRSLLNEYIGNLFRMGIIPAVGQDESGSTERRVLAALEKFEAVYGPLPNARRLARRILHGEREISDDRDMGGGISSLLAPTVAIPLTLSTILIALGWLLVLDIPATAPDLTALVGPAPPDASGRVSLAVLAFPRPEPTYFAFLGAYFFAIQMLFRRYVRRDLGPSAYVAVSQRIILAVIGAWAAYVALLVLKPTNAEEYAAIIGFVIGVFPRIAWQFVSAAIRTFSFSWLLLPSLRSRLPLSDLDGLTVWHEARLEEEDIENIPNMATADPVDLMLNTRFPPGRIIDWIDQSILYTAIGPDPANGDSLCEGLRRFGVRTASALRVIARQTAPGQPVTLGELDPVAVTELVRSLEIYPNLRLVEAWRGITAPTANEQPVAPERLVEIDAPARDPGAGVTTRAGRPQ